MVSVHLSAQMSGTVESARLAAKESPVPVEVVDSESLGMGLGFAVLSAAAAAAGGRPIDEVAEAAAASGRRRRTAVFYVDTLEHLRRGGRIGAAAALLGSALAVKPLLHLVDGHIEPLEKVRTSAQGDRPARGGRRRALPGERHRWTSRCTTSPARTGPTRWPTGCASGSRASATCYVSEVGAVVGAHVGPGMLAVVVAPR